MKRIRLLTILMVAAVYSMAATTDTISCGDIRANKVTSGLHWVEGFIVGWPVQNKGNEYTTTAPTSGANSQLSLADDAQGTNCIPVQVAYAAQQELTGGVAANIGKKILIRGNVATYFKVNGLTGTSAVVFLESKAMQGISIAPADTAIQVTETFTIVPTFTPADPDDKRITWTSTDASVASVDKGVVTGVKNGTAYIIATTVDGGYKDSTFVVVGDPGQETRMADIIVLDTTKATKTDYVNWTCTGASGTQYAGKNAKDQTANAMQFTGKSTTYSGIVNTTSKGYIREIKIEWNSSCQDRTINIYGGNTAYTLEGLYETSVQDNIIGTIAKGTTSYKIKGNYAYMGIRVSNSKAALLDKVTFIWGIQKHEEEDIPLTAVRLDKDSLTIEAESTAKLTVTYEPDSATNKGVTWSSSNTAIATVQDGIVTGVAAGEAMIIATSTDGQQLADTCYVTVTKKDLWQGRDVYYKIHSLSELHHNDSVVFVNETANRASADFETYTYSRKDDKQQLIEYTAGRIAAAELEIIRDGDSIGCWGVDPIRVAKTTQGWQIYVLVEEEDPYEQGAFIAVEKLLRANEMNKLMIAGEGNQYWDITFAANGNAVITSKDAKVGTIQFNSNNKTFTTYTSTQAPIQIYRKKYQTIDPTGFEAPSVGFPVDGQPHKVLHNGQLIIVRDGKELDVLGRILQSR